jgi:hypothetical protein
LFTSGQFLGQEQLTSADVSYQMVGLCDYKNALLSYPQYIQVPSQAKQKISET